MADEQDKSQKTEPATQKKLDDSRKKGQVPQSREPATAIVFAVAASISGTGVGSYLYHTLAHTFQRAWDYDHWAQESIFTPANFSAEMWLYYLEIFKMVLAVAIPISAISVLATVLVSGPVLALEAVQPKMEKVSPLKGLQRLFSLKSGVEFLKSLAKITILSWVSWLIISSLWDRMITSSHLDPLSICLLAVEGITAIAFAAAATYTTIALADVLYQKHHFAEEMKMTMKEIKDEHKDSEGDPQLKGKIKQLQFEMASKRMMADVPDATVVITNPTHYSIALTYDGTDAAVPKLVAKGVDHIARKIREIAKENDVAIVESPPLARTLYAQVEIGDYIPVSLYEPVAVIITQVLRQSGKIPD